MLSNLTHTLFEEGFGYYTFKKDIHEIEVTTNTKYEIASITKIMATGLAVMNGVNEGKLAYSDRITKFFHATENTPNKIQPLKFYLAQFGTIL